MSRILKAALLAASLARKLSVSRGRPPRPSSASNAEGRLMSPAAFRETLESDVVKWAKAVRASGAKLD